MAIEIELKLAITAEGAAQLSTFLANYIVLEQKKLDLTNTYYDTPDFQLQQNHCGLRVRGFKEEDEPQQYEMTMKRSNAGVAGLHSRQEYNVVLAEPSVDLYLLPQEALPITLNRQQLAAKVTPLFTTHFLRHTWLIRYHQSDIEIAFDQGTISDQKDYVPIDELELELKQGDVNTLFEFAADLSMLGVRLLSQSKAARGYRLINSASLTYPKISALKEANDPRNALQTLLKYWQKSEEFAIDQHQEALLYDRLTELLPRLSLLLNSLIITPVIEMARDELNRVTILLQSRPELASWLYYAEVTKLKLHLTQIMLSLQD